ncbi:hypothetical protein ACFOW1_10430 [Parasediminibacterium paludis]|jgi:hypothetical protein|uniref:Uncharacterized protein n=1 Tax=Parasediminibacterium paludis TaxID=908966 RepID=A0ABV8PXM7_9BACT
MRTNIYAKVKNAAFKQSFLLSVKGKYIYDYMIEMMLMITVNIIPSRKHKAQIVVDIK